MDVLPIDSLLPDIVGALRTASSVVIEAPPGAGKTTRVPRALFDAGFAATGEILVLQPRRLPARLAAQRVAEELGEPTGGTVGYTVRFEESAGPRTRIRFVTEGILTRRLLTDPTLRGVSAVLLDEFHERHLATDLALSLLRRLQQTSRPDLKLAVMSATLDADPVCAYLDGAPRVRSQGRRYDVAIAHLPQPDDRPLSQQVASAVRQLLRETPDGDILVFLPGAGEIRRSAEALAALPGADQLLVLPLHGEMTLADQNRAVRPADRRKVILSTNVAETSVTIDGVVAVVDGGLARQAAHSPWTGLPKLTVSKISQASAIQRAGRAGRTRPGRALRLYTQHDFETRRRYDPAEIARADLADTALTLRALGVRRLTDFPFFEAPPPAALAAADELLQRLGAIMPSGELTPLGRRMMRFPVHPRLARLVCAGEDRAVTDAACTTAALIGERDIRMRGRAAFGGSGGGRGSADPADGTGIDLLELVDLFGQAQRTRFGADRLRSLGLDARAVETAERARRQLRAAAEPPAGGGGGGGARRGADADADDQALALATLAAFPDRVARRRAGGGRTVLLSGGGAADLGWDSGSDWLVAVDVEERATASRGGNRIVVRLGVAIQPDWLLDLFADDLHEQETLALNPTTEQVERTYRLSYRALAVDESVTPAPPSDETAQVLARAAVAFGVEKLDQDGALVSLRQRVRFLKAAMPEAAIPSLDDDELAAALRSACAGLRSFTELRELGLSAHLFHSFSPEAQRQLRTLAPETLTLPGGRSVPINYELHDAPSIASRLQDFFGMSQTPRVAGGRVALTVHLLAPNYRAVQVTRDLENFWRQHYPPLRRELGRRYPRHAWPEDGATASPPAPRRR